MACLICPDKLSLFGHQAGISTCLMLFQ